MLTPEWECDRPRPVFAVLVSRRPAVSLPACARRHVLETRPSSAETPRCSTSTTPPTVHSRQSTATRLTSVVSPTPQTVSSPLRATTSSPPTCLPRSARKPVRSKTRPTSSRTGVTNATAGQITTSVPVTINPMTIVPTSVPVTQTRRAETRTVRMCTTSPRPATSSRTKLRFPVTRAVTKSHPAVWLCKTPLGPHQP